MEMTRKLTVSPIWLSPTMSHVPFSPASSCQMFFTMVGMLCLTSMERVEEESEVMGINAPLAETPRPLAELSWSRMK